jgi:hypothetical protein
VFEYIEAFYNRERRHSTLGMRSPVAYEQLQLDAEGCGRRLAKPPCRRLITDETRSYVAASISSPRASSLLRARKAGISRTIPFVIPSTRDPAIAMATMRKSAFGGC